jgi:hypothetical protein
LSHFENQTVNSTEGTRPPPNTRLTNDAAFIPWVRKIESIPPHLSSANGRVGATLSRAEQHEDSRTATAAEQNRRQPQSENRNLEPLPQ